MTNDRVVEVVEDLERTLVEFIRKHRINHREYRAATSLVIDSIKQGEESLLPDVFFEAEATDIGNEDHVGSSAAIEGPFYIAGAPLLEAPCVMPQRDDERGTPMVFTGTVTGTDGNALGGAIIDMWHADADGLYSGIHPGIPDWNLRGRFATGPDGGFSVSSILPPPYEIPKNGPTGIVLSALGRHFFRPAHIHLKVTADGYEPLTSQLYFPGGDYVDNDVANAVRDGLMLKVEQTDRDVRVTYDFVLVPETR
ncbi:dioxygenase [Mycobacterium kyogaense]|uniref:dioxygenase family protein n=1 Tax=Mycobacterium kyogaense TaxID=2212479 RepID=UPI0013C537C9|nr:dioxygenase [Mycobacterium kyogaense]